MLGPAVAVVVAVPIVVVAGKNHAAAEDSGDGESEEEAFQDRSLSWGYAGSTMAGVLRWPGICKRLLPPAPGLKSSRPENVRGFASAAILL